MSTKSDFSTIAYQTIIVNVARLALFLGCRKYLLRSLYHDLKDLSTDDVAETYTPLRSGSKTPVGGEPIELGMLPQPSTTPDSGNGVMQQMQNLERRRAVHSTLAHTSFALCFEESCTLFLLLICQSADVLDSRSRKLNWRMSLFLLLAMNLVFIPLFFSLALTSRRQSTSAETKPSGKATLLTRSLLAILPVATYLFVLSYVPLPAALASGDYISIALARLTVVGTVILGLLSGFGAASNAWAYFPMSAGRKSNVPTDADVDVAERSLARIRDDLSQRRAELQKREAAKTPQTETWLARVVPSFRGDSSLASAAQEIRGLEALEYQMSGDVHTLRQRRADGKFEQTLLGRLVNWSGLLFALYCVFRFVAAIVNILASLTYDGSRYSAEGGQSATAPDAITRVLASLIAFLPSVDLSLQEIAALARQISFALVGIIILSSVRLVLRGVTRVLRVTSRNQGAALMLLLLAQLMVIYLLSTLVQLRTSFPPPPPPPSGAATDDSAFNLFSTLPEYHLTGSLFDWSYVLSAVASVAVRWLGERVNG